MEERNELIEWVKENKKELIVAGVGIGALTLITLDIRSKAAVIAIWETLKKAVRRPAGTVAKVAAEVSREPICEAVVLMGPNSESLPFLVRHHLRNLPKGQHASPQKLADAMKVNFVLMDGQTWVKAYMNGGSAA